MLPIYEGNLRDALDETAIVLNTDSLVLVSEPSGALMCVAAARDGARLRAPDPECGAEHSTAPRLCTRCS